MYSGKSLAVVIPAKNESRQIAGVLRTLPDCVDKALVIDDASTDDTAQVVRAVAREVSFPVQLIRHEVSRGVGGAIAAGYARARDERCEITVVMAGDGQMDPDDLAAVVEPVAGGLADYSKGNRFQWARGLERIPRQRLFGNFVLSMLTKVVSGYWHVSDTQSGYTAISLEALESIPVEEIYPTYGCPNDILVKLNIAGMRVVEVPINPRYNVGEQSKMRIGRVILPILLLLGRGFFQRMFRRYVIENGHPLIFAYLFAAISLSAALGLGGYLTVEWALTGLVRKAALTAAGVALLLGFQLILNAFQMDLENNRNLCVQLPARRRRTQAHRHLTTSGAEELRRAA